MRSLSDAERALIAAGAVNVHARCEVTDADGGWRTLSALSVPGSGVFSLFTSASGDASLDQAADTCTITLRRDATVLMLDYSVQTVSIAPTVQASPLNRRSNGTYGPLVDVGRFVRLSLALTAPSVAPVTGDWRGLFWGVIDDVDWAATDGSVPLSCRDLGALVLDRQIETEHDYGADAGTPLEDVLRSILDDNGFSAVPLVVQGDPAWALQPYTQTYGSVLQAMRDLAAQIGWDVRYQWRGAAGAYGTFDLVLGEPDRTRTTPNATLTGAEYKAITALKVSLADVRNAVKVTYTDSATATRASVTSTDTASIAKFGRRFMEIAEEGASNIDTSAEATRLADAAVHDLSEPAADQTVTTVGFWAAQLGDLLGFTANGVHYDTPQALAVQGLHWDLTPGHYEATLRTRGAVAGLYRTWLAKATTATPTPAAPASIPTLTAAVRDDLSTTTTFVVGFTARVVPVTLAVTVKAQYRTGTTLPLSGAWTDASAGSAGVNVGTVSVTRTGAVQYLEVRALTSAGGASDPQLFTVAGTNPKAAAVADLSVLDYGVDCTTTATVFCAVTFDAVPPSGWTVVLQNAYGAQATFATRTADGTQVAFSGVMPTTGYGKDTAHSQTLGFRWTLKDAGAVTQASGVVKKAAFAFATFCGGGTGGGSGPQDPL